MASLATNRRERVVRGVALFLALVSVVLAVPMKPTKVYLNAMKNALDAEDELLICRAANHTERLKDIQCFVRALSVFPYNASWAKQGGALYIMTAQRKRAYQMFNHSYQTVLEAQGILNNPKVQYTGMSPVTWLKLYFAREKAGSLELAKVWFQSLQMEHQTWEAKKIVDDFVEELEDYSESADLFRVLGSIVDVVKVKQEWRRWKEENRQKKAKRAGSAVTSAKREKETTINVVLEELVRIAEELSNRWLSAPLTATKVGYNESQAFSKATCGVGFQYKSSYTASELVNYLTICMAKWGELRKHLQNEGQPEPYGALLRTALHTVSEFGSEFLVKMILEEYPDLLLLPDNFGSTALHMAAAAGNRRSLTVLAKAGGIDSLKMKDAGGFSALHLGCSNKFFRADMESFMEATFGVASACGPYTVYEKFSDDTIEDDSDDDIPPGGGWRDAVTRDEPECAFDVRSGTSISHHELIGRYLHSNRPIVLRGVIPSGIRRSLQRKHFIPSYHDFWVRHEEYPAAELFGGTLHNITSILKWTKNSTETFGSIEVDKKHPLSKLLAWLPERLVPVKEGYTTTDDSWPMLVLAGKSARTNFVFRSAHYAHAVVHGVQHWTVVHPISARSTRDKIDLSRSEPNSLKCTLHSGDVLVLPSLWGAAYVSQGESIAFSRRFLWK